jgi:hypothetical protein
MATGRQDAESVTSVDVQPVESVRVGDGFGHWPQGCGAVQGAVGSVLVVERFELSECVEQVDLIPDQQPSAASPHAGGRVNL